MQHTEAERVCPHEKDGAAHDAYTRQLHRLVPTTERSVIGHWSGKHKQVVSGINLVTMLRTDGGRHIPVGCRIYGGDELTSDELVYGDDTRNHHLPLL